MTMITTDAAASQHWVQGWAPDAGGTAPAYHIAAPDPLALEPRALGVQLARLNRFTGATCESWNVADHQRLVARIARRWVARDVACDRRHWRIVVECLIHDVPEVITGDIPAPALRYLETVLPGSRAAIDHHLHAPMLRAFRVACGLPPAPPIQADTTLIHRSDLTALAVEKTHLMAEPPAPWPPLPAPPPLAGLGIRGALRASATPDAAAEAWRRALEEALDMLGVRPLWHLPADVAAVHAARLMGQD